MPVVRDHPGGALCLFVSACAATGGNVQGLLGHTMGHPPKTEIWTLIVKVCTPHPFSADLSLLRPAHTRFADLDAAKMTGSTSLTPPDSGACEISGPEKQKQFL